MELQIFSNSEFGEIRTITKDNEPMFCLADVCKALEISNVGNVKQRLSEKGIHTADTLTKGGMQKMTLLVKLIFTRQSFRAVKKVRKDLQNGLHQRFFHQSERQEVTVSL